MGKAVLQFDQIWDKRHAESRLVHFLHAFSFLGAAETLLWDFFAQKARLWEVAENDEWATKGNIKRLDLAQKLEVWKQE